MKLFLPIAVLCLLAVVSCKKADQQSKEKYHTWSEKKSHNVKKYNQEKAHHHDKYQKMHNHENPITHESHVTEPKHHTQTSHGYHEVPKHEAELQRDIKSSKKEIEDRLAKEEQDLHLQDLTHPDDPSNAGHKNHKSPHQYQRGHHKTGNHFSHSKGQKAPHKEEKLFVFPETKQAEPKETHPVLEDSFEALSEGNIPEQQESDQHSQSKKKGSKNKKSHKKAYEKVKEKTKSKENEKKKNKEKNKKQQYKGKKEKKQA